MQKQWTSRTPNYFFTVFGGGNRPPVGGRHYPHHRGHIISKDMQAGDVMLLYCGADYPKSEYSQKAPGIGIVVDIETNGREEVIYQYFPLEHPVSLANLRANIPEIKDHEPLNLVGNWLFQIARKSFRDTLKGRQIYWP